MPSNDWEPWFREALRLHQAGEGAQAIACYQETLAREPRLAEAHNNLGTLLRQSGRLDEAAASFQRAVEFKPEHADAWFNLGRLRQAQGRAADAMACFDQARTFAPQDAEAGFAWAQACRQAGESARAREGLLQVLALQPGFAPAWGELAALYEQNGQLEEARATYEQATRLLPQEAAVHDRLGAVLQRLGRFAEAAACHGRALALRPEEAETHNNLGGALVNLGRAAQAAEHCRRALQLRPQFPEAYNNLAVALAQQDQSDLAVEAFQAAVSQAPGYTEAHQNLAEQLAAQGRTPEARTALERAAATRPGTALGLQLKAALLMPRIPASTAEILFYRERLARELDQLSAGKPALRDPMGEVGQSNFWLAYHALDDRQLQERIAEFYLRASPGLGWVAPHCRQPGEGPARRRLRVGFVSAYLHNHTIGKLTHGLIQHLARDRFEVWVFRVPGKQDALAADIDRSADRVVALPALLEPARHQLAAAQCDVLYYPEVGIDARTYYLAFARMARVQCTTFGHPDTSGLPHMDYFLSAEDHEVPGSEHQFTEKLIRFRRWATYYYRPRLKASPRSRGDWGLPAEGRLYVLAQSLFKLHPDFDPVLGRILERDPQGWLVLLSGSSAHWDRLLRERLARTFPEAMRRIIFLPRLAEQDFFQLCRLADALLDPPQFSGGNGSLEAFAFGAPIVAWPGEFVRNRLTYGCYRQMDLMDCVAHDADSYVDIALRLAQNRDWHREMEQRILARCDCLYENPLAVRELEEFFLRAVEEKRQAH